MDEAMALICVGLVSIVLVIYWRFVYCARPTIGNAAFLLAFGIAGMIPLFRMIFETEEPNAADWISLAMFLFVYVLLAIASVLSGIDYPDAETGPAKKRAQKGAP